MHDVGKEICLQTISGIKVFRVVIIFIFCEILKTFFNCYFQKKTFLGILIQVSGNITNF